MAPQIDTVTVNNADIRLGIEEMQPSFASLPATPATHWVALDIRLTFAVAAATRDLHFFVGNTDLVNLYAEFDLRVTTITNPETAYVSIPPFFFIAGGGLKLNIVSNNSGDTNVSGVFNLLSLDVEYFCDRLVAAADALTNSLTDRIKNANVAKWNGTGVTTNSGSGLPNVDGTGAMGIAYGAVESTGSLTATNIEIGTMIPSYRDGVAIVPAFTDGMLFFLTGVCAGESQRITEFEGQGSGHWDITVASAFSTIPSVADKCLLIPQSLLFSEIAKAAICTEARLAELDAANLPADVDATLADTNELQTDWVNGGRLDLLLDAIPTTAMRGTDNAALASVCTEARLAELDALNLPADVDAVLADSNELQTDWVNGGRLDLLLDAVNTVTPPTVAEMEARTLPTANYATAAALGTHDTDLKALLPDVYHARILLTVDEANSKDEYTVRWFKNAAMVASGITLPKIQVTKRVDGTDLVALVAMTQIGVGGGYKYDEPTNRITAGEAVEAVVTASIDGSTRTWSEVLSRDSSA